eukprot:TRINITY_DN4578_c0_g1_i1.p1 TRINITY_DN4578_c0_g1~~TRINITY_DN4578_c0_g1_i1.p1  ORF type:complete len:748 (+),score=349.68 TRINITY_DN4578_c0_g1_i1:160-2244(+)
MAARGRSIEDKVKELKRRFGNALQEDGLRALLEAMDGNLEDCIQMLQADRDEQVFEVGNDNLPPNYHDHPAGFREIPKKNDGDDLPANIIRKAFLEDTRPEELVIWAKSHLDLVKSVFLMLTTNGVVLSSVVKSRLLAAVLEVKDSDFLDFLLSKTQDFGLPEVLKAIKVVDARRKIRLFERKLRALEESKSKPKTITKTRALLHNVQQDIIPGVDVNATGAVCRHVKKWSKRFTALELLFFALQMPMNHWQELADTIHFAPRDFSVDWFLEFAFGKAPPADSIVSRCREMDEQSLLQMLGEEHLQIPYSFIRVKLNQKVPDAAKALVAEYEPLDQIIWYYEELATSPRVQEIVGRRLAGGESVSLSYGKLMERLLTFRKEGVSFADHLIPIAEERLRNIRLFLEPPVVVLGDASFSMDVAIRTSTIIASLLSVLCNADLLFFNDTSFPPSQVPRTVEQVLQVALQTRPFGQTAPACTLLDFYRRRQVVKSFVLVSDEGENAPVDGYYFAQLFYKYYTEVHPANLIMVSFLSEGGRKGRMTVALERLGITPLVFRFDGRRPDLTKLDSLFGILSSFSSSFAPQAQRFSEISAASKPSTADLLNIIRDPSSLSPSESSSSSSSSSSAEPMVVEGAKEGEGSPKAEAVKECPVCLSDSPNTALVPCGHLYCGDCAPTLSTCAMCRSVVEKTIRVYL